MQLSYSDIQICTVCKKPLEKLKTHWKPPLRCNRCIRKAKNVKVREKRLIYYKLNGNIKL